LPPKKKFESEIRQKILNSLGSEEKLTFTELINKTDLSPPVLAKYLKKLEGEHEILMTLDKDDRRKKHYSLSNTGDYYKQKEFALECFSYFQTEWNKIEEQKQIIQKKGKFEPYTVTAVGKMHLIGSVIYEILLTGKAQKKSMDIALNTFLKILSIYVVKTPDVDWVEIRTRTRKDGLYGKQWENNLSLWFKESYKGTEDGINKRLHNIYPNNQEKQKEIKEFIFSF
jgi:DNA-binding MarR family transcriptional regulator